MLRFLLWFLLILLLLRIIRLAFGGKPRPPERPLRKNGDSFDHIQDADFEDLTPKPPPPAA
ncbi:MAG TPA: hypothetical protein VMW43_11795 [Bacteroidota bacterium]|nr:hypothetical protein [Bacteroidota bacterium]